MFVEVLRVLAAVGCGLVAGFLFAFSAGIMTALGKLPAARGTAAMQAINVAVLNPVFLIAFVGTALLSGALVVAVVVTGGPLGAIVGAALYVVGTFGVTMVVNVPMNNALAAATSDVDEVWERYRLRWTRWNHLRTLAATVALAVLVTT